MYIIKALKCNAKDGSAYIKACSVYTKKAGVYTKPAGSIKEDYDYNLSLDENLIHVAKLLGYKGDACLVQELEQGIYVFETRLEIASLIDRLAYEIG